MAYGIGQCFSLNKDDMPIPGMKPAVPKTRPEPLQPNVPYRLIIEAEGGYIGQVDFKTVPTPQQR